MEVRSVEEMDGRMVLGFLGGCCLRWEGEDWEEGDWERGRIQISGGGGAVKLQRSSPDNTDERTILLNGDCSLWHSLSADTSPRNLMLINTTIL